MTKTKSNPVRSTVKRPSARAAKRLPARRKNFRGTRAEELEERIQARTAELHQANAELRAEIQARQRAEAANRRLAAIVESSSDAIMSCDSASSIMSWNKGAEKLFGYSIVEIVGRSIRILQPEDHREEAEELIARIRRRETVESFETVRLHKDGSRLDVSLSLSPILEDTGEMIGTSAIIRDISGRKRTERALRESEARLNAIIDKCPSLIFLKDTQGRYLHFNHRFALEMKLRLEDAVGKTDAQVFPLEQATLFRANDLAVINAATPIVFDEIASHEDGPHTNIVTKFPLFDADGKVYAVGGIVTDITERKRLEEEILHTSEREQRRIAQDLHDGLGQQLTGLWCLSEVLRKNLRAQSPRYAPAVGRISRMLKNAVAQTRDLARGLHPVEPEPAGLMSALDGLVVRVSALFKVSCTLECPKPVMIEEKEVATQLYRIAQEAVSNAIKHGRAQKIKIGLSAPAELIILTISDDGVGFKQNTKRKPGLGMRIMSHRAGLIGGTIIVQKRSEGGVKVVCALGKTIASAPQKNDEQKITKPERNQAAETAVPRG